MLKTQLRKFTEPECIAHTLNMFPHTLSPSNKPDLNSQAIWENWAEQDRNELKGGWLNVFQFSELTFSVSLLLQHRTDETVEKAPFSDVWKPHCGVGVNEEGGENLIVAEETISVCEIAWVAGWCLELFDTSHRGWSFLKFQLRAAPQYNPWLQAPSGSLNCSLLTPNSSLFPIPHIRVMVIHLRCIAMCCIHIALNCELWYPLLYLPLTSDAHFFKGHLM